MAKVLTKGELLNRLGIAAPQTLTALLQEMEEAGIEVPSEGEGRSRRYYVGAVKAIKDYRANREPRKRGPKPGGRKASQSPAGARTAQPAAYPDTFLPASIRLEAPTLALEPLRLAEEDRALLRELVTALDGVAGQLRAVGLNLNAVEAELQSMGNRTATPQAPPQRTAPHQQQGQRPGGGRRFDRPRARHSQPRGDRPEGHERGNG
jgi:hypothetical protein